MTDDRLAVVVLALLIAAGVAMVEYVSGVVTVVTLTGYHR